MNNCFVFETVKGGKLKSNFFNIKLSGFCFNCENYNESLKIVEGLLICEFCRE
ncbi:MAG: hypothetical protein GTN36_01080 [Candidatus Aenigmarchaeota archaeon]|nr:hypothetical protein [Candidatus Aenigmarchaeota archaeon]